MKIFEKIQMFFGVLGTIVLIVLGILQFVNDRHKPTILEIKTISGIELTRPLNVEHLSSTYLYFDSIPVEHLWQSSYVITNIGGTSLYGKGFDVKNIKGDALLFHLANCEKILSIELIKTNAGICLQDKSLQFSQWRPNEYVEIRIISDGPTFPELQIDERDIIDGKVMYAKYSLEERTIKKRLVDNLPETSYKVLWWVVVIFYIIIALVSIGAAVQQYKNAEDKTARTITLVVWIVSYVFMLAPLLWMF